MNKFKLNFISFTWFIIDSALKIFASVTIYLFYFCRCFLSRASLLYHQRLMHFYSANPKHHPTKSVEFIDEYHNYENLIHSGVLSEITDLIRSKYSADSVHANNVPSSKPFACSFCLCTFVSQAEQKKHQQLLHVDNNATTCSRCHREFATRRRCQNHQQKYCGRTFPCDEPACHKKFRSQLALQFHIRQHLGLSLMTSSARVLKCRWRNCSRTFGARSALHRHRRLHRTPVTCPCCWRTAVHSGAISLSIGCPRRQLVCKTCGKHMHSSAVFDRHQRLMYCCSANDQPDTAPLDPNTPFYYCNTCWQVCTSHAELLLHLRWSRRQHQHTCPCLIMWENQTQYESHMKRHHKRRKHRQDRLASNEHQPATDEYIIKDAEEIELAEMPPPPSAPPVRASVPDSCVVSVMQEGTPVPVNRGTPFTRVLNLRLPASLSPEVRSNRKKVLHRFIFQLRNLIQDALPHVSAVPEKGGEVYAGYFEQILNAPSVQQVLAEMGEYAVGCGITFSVPFPCDLVSMVWVNFMVSFERAAVM